MGEVGGESTKVCLPNRQFMIKGNLKTKTYLQVECCSTTVVHGRRGGERDREKKWAASDSEGK